MKLVLFVLLLSVITAFSLADCGDNLDCIANARFIKKRHYRNDFSVNYSIYLSMNGTKYENYVTLQSLNYTGEPVPAANHTDPELLNYSWAKDGLEESLSTSLGAVEEINFNRKINYYVLYAAIDLMNYHYTKLDTTDKVWKFSVEQLIHNLSVDQYDNVQEVMEYLLHTGVCEEKRYANRDCTERYTIDDYQHLNQEYTNQALLDALQVGPLYVQVGLHPYYVQLHTPDCQDPIRIGFNRPTFAGVLTGYDLTTIDEEFWEMYIRRHGDNYNKVKLACVFEKCMEDVCEQRPPFAGLASKMYQIEVVGEIKPISTIDIPASGDTMITDTESLKQVIEEAAAGSESVLSVKLPLDRIDCSSSATIDFSDFTSLVDLIIVGEDPTCLAYMQFNDNVNLIFAPAEDSSSSGRRLEGESNAVKEIKFVGSPMRSIMFGNNLFNNYNYNIHIEDCQQLTSIIIGSNTFTLSSSFRIINNEKLTTLDIGEGAFGGVNAVEDSKFEISNLPAIKLIEFRNNSMNNFLEAHTLDIQANSNLELRGDNAFMNMEKCYLLGTIHEAVDEYFRGKGEVVEEIASTDKLIDAAVTTGGSFLLSGNLTITSDQEFKIPPGVTLDLDLSGNSLDVGGNNFIVEDTLALTNGTMNSPSAALKNYGNATLTDVVVNSGSPSDYGMISYAGSTTTYNNVNLNSGGGAVGAVGANCTVVFNSGSINVASTSTSGRYLFYVVDGASVTISGGDFAFSSTQNQKRAYAYVDANSSLYIKGGTFGPASTRSGYTAGILGDGEIVITGGTFGFDPSAWVKEGYSAVKSGKQWIVSAN